MRRKREEFRVKLISLIIAKTDEVDKSSEFPTKDEREILRYYNYIKHGIDTLHVSPMNPKVFKRYFCWYKCVNVQTKSIILTFRIQRGVPKLTAKQKLIIDHNMVEVNQEYVLAVKKSVVDFVLGESLTRKITSPQAESLSAERLDLRSISMKYKHRCIRIR